MENIEGCKAYMESLGWRFLYFNRPWYVFEKEGKTLSWTLHDIRHAKAYGW